MSNKFEQNIERRYDLLKATEKRFDVRLSVAEHRYRHTFDLGPGEILFQGEGLFNYYGSGREFTRSGIVNRSREIARASRSPYAAQEKGGKETPPTKNKKEEF